MSHLMTNSIQIHFYKKMEELKIIVKNLKTTNKNFKRMEKKFVVIDNTIEQIKNHLRYIDVFLSSQKNNFNEVKTMHDPKEQTKLTTFGYKNPLGIKERELINKGVLGDGGGFDLQESDQENLIKYT